MQDAFKIKKVAVLGAGVMGAQIAAHCANAGYQIVLFDLAADGKDANQIVNAAIQRLAKLKPSPIATKAMLGRIEAANYDDSLEKLHDCDIVIEAIAEKMEWKKALYQKIKTHLNHHSIVVTNTSGLSVNALMEMFPKELQSRFCGVHFFNPPRYMHLAELIPSKNTSSELLDYLESWLTSFLGKGVVRAKDTPNFIANRIGVFSLLATMHHAEQFGISADEVDVLTGTALGRPKSATMRTMDVVGLDTMKHVVFTMHDQLKDDPWHAYYQLPAWIESLIEKGALGQKAGQGIYRKNGKTIEVIDPSSGEYKPSEAKVSESMQKIMHIKDSEERMAALFASEDKQAKFLSAYFIDLYHYCAYHLESIADSVRDVDLAIRWGFGWQTGPFESWLASGKVQCQQAIEKAIKSGESMAKVALPAWLEKIDAFYTAEGAYCPKENKFKKHSALAVYKKQLDAQPLIGEKQTSRKIIYENEGVKLWSLADDVAVLSLKSKANTFNAEVLDGMHEAIALVEKQCQGMIIYQHNHLNFSSGANLKEIGSLIKQEKFDAISEMIKAFQEMSQRLRYSSIPVVAALRGRALGGGCEAMLHCDAVVAAFESYPGLVELGVGLIPAGGGCKEMARRAMLHATDSDLMDYIQPYFMQIAMGKVSSNAIEAMEDGYLLKSDNYVMHQEEVLAVALEKVKYLSEANYLPPVAEKIKIAGIEGRARIQVGLVNMLEGAFISEHDYYLATELATVLCGGELNQGSLVEESWLLQLEREAFLRLCQTPKTQERIEYMMTKGKPLRN
jgi:3-hydroxyacyl-CoA dehydrogenase